MISLQGVFKRSPKLICKIWSILLGRRTLDSGPSEGTTSVKLLIANIMRDLCFSRFLQIYTGASIQQLDLLANSILHDFPSEMAQLLSRTPNLHILCIIPVCKIHMLDRRVHSAIFQLSKHRENIAIWIRATAQLRSWDIHLVSCPCRHSLRRIRLLSDYRRTMGIGASNNTTVCSLSG